MNDISFEHIHLLLEYIRAELQNNNLDNAKKLNNIVKYLAGNYNKNLMVYLVPEKNYLI